MSGVSVTRLDLARADHGEGAIAQDASGRHLLWADSSQSAADESGRVRRYDTTTGKESVLEFGSFVGTVCPAQEEGRCVVATNSLGFASAALPGHIEGELGAFEWPLVRLLPPQLPPPLLRQHLLLLLLVVLVLVALASLLLRSLLTLPPRPQCADPRRQHGGGVAANMNDGKCDPQGRLWCGTEPTGENEGKPLGHLFCLAPGAPAAQLKLSDVSCSNGLVWTASGDRMLYIDTTEKKEVSSFKFDGATGEISDRSVAISAAGDEGTKGFLDGCTLDADGHLWVAHWGGSCVTEWDVEAGKKLRTIEVPDAPNTTSVGFAGEGLQTLYVTSSCLESAEPQGNGRLHAIAGTGARGVAPNCFGASETLDDYRQDTAFAQKVSKDMA